MNSAQDLAEEIKRLARDYRNGVGWPLSVRRELDAAIDRLRDLAAPQPAEPVRPDILEKLTYHQHERDDMTLDDVLSYLATGWKTVPGRTERQLILQLCALLAGAPQPAERKPLTDGWQLIAVREFEPLMRALERAESKGYMPDAMADEWVAFEYRAHGIGIPPVEAKEGA